MFTVRHQLSEFHAQLKWKSLNILAANIFPYIPPTNEYAYKLPTSSVRKPKQLYLSMRTADIEGN